MGVEVRCGRPVEAIDAHGVVVGGARLAAATVAWTAGVAPTPAAAWMGASVDRSGRVRVASDLSVPGRGELFAIGDVAFVEQDGRALPGVAQVALQQGRYVARLIAARLAGGPVPPPFRYRDLGNMAVVGRNFALLERRSLRLGGYLAWLAWALVHLESLALFSNRLAVFTRWAWQYFTRQRGSRLILGKP
jgi:NADH dehydrogenase FAD-containing subunit